VHKLEYLPSAADDILEIENYLYERSPLAADKFTEAIEHQMKNLAGNPFMCRIYEEDDYFRSMILPYKYRLFYHVDEETETIKVHRILHGMRDLKSVMELEID